MAFFGRSRRNCDRHSLPISMTKAERRAPEVTQLWSRTNETLCSAHEVDGGAGVAAIFIRLLDARYAALKK